MPLLQFTPEPNPTDGPAFSVFFKLLGTVMVAGCALWCAALLQQGQLVITSRGSWLMLLGGLAVMGWTLWHILRSRTRIDAQGLYQSWIWDKRMATAELGYAKLIRVRGLEWLIAPRLYTRSVSNKLAVFYLATPALWREGERLAQAVEAMRIGMRTGA